MNTGSRKYLYRDELEGIMAEGEIFHTYLSNLYSHQED